MKNDNKDKIIIKKKFLENCYNKDDKNNFCFWKEGLDKILFIGTLSAVLYEGNEV